MNMQAVKAYRAYYDDGLFIPYEPVTIPKGCQVVVTVLDFLAEDVQEADEQNICANSHNAAIIMQEADPSKSMLGLWEGEVTVPDDFNAPLEDLKEYMY
jgi:predicted DNA-binding antitoxin AbrB/MazE fold protein